MANKVIITKSKLNALGANMRQTHGLDHNPTIDEMAALALVPTGGSGGGNESGGGIEIPQVSNIAVDSDGVLTFDAPVIEGLTDYILEYIINVNGSETKTTETTINVKGSLVNGENTISIICVLTFNDGEETVTIEFEKEIIITVVVSSYTMSTKISGISNSVVTIGDYAYIFGGYSTSSLNAILRYNTKTNQTPTAMGATLPWGNYDNAAVEINGKAYIFGGTEASAYDYIWCYDPVADTITTMGASLSKEMFKMSAVAINGKAYIFGGYNNGWWGNTIQCYDPETDTITTLSVKLPKSMAYNTAVAINGKAYIFGGFDSSWNHLDTIICYDPSANKVTTMGATLISPMTQITSMNIDGKAYIIGGYNSSTKTYFDTIQCYDPVADICTPIEQTLSVGLYQLGATAVNGWGYFFGGISSSGGTNLIHIMKVE